MMFIVRTSGDLPVLAGVALKARRRTPGIVPNAAGKIDYFCVAEEAAVTTLHDHGLDVEAASRTPHSAREWASAGDRRRRHAGRR